MLIFAWLYMYMYLKCVHCMFKLYMCLCLWFSDFFKSKIWTIQLFCQGSMYPHKEDFIVHVHSSPIHASHKKQQNILEQQQTLGLKATDK